MIVAVDFDGTIAENDNFPAVGSPVPGALKWLTRFNDEGIDIILWTVRSAEALKLAENYMADAGIRLFGVNVNPDQSSFSTSPKVFADAYIDDRAIGAPLISFPSKPPFVDWGKAGPQVLNLKK